MVYSKDPSNCIPPILHIHQKLPSNCIALRGHKSLSPTKSQHQMLHKHQSVHNFWRSPIVSELHAVPGGNTVWLVFSYESTGDVVESDVWARTRWMNAQCQA